VQIKDSGKQETICDLRMPLQLRCLDTNFSVMLVHTVGTEEEKSVWMIFPATSEDFASQYIDNIRMCEKLADTQVLHLLLSLVVEYAYEIQDNAADKQAVDFFTKLREMTIDAIEKFFPLAGKMLSDMRLSNPESPAYQKVSATIFLFRVFLAGRLFQFHVERAIDGSLAQDNDNEPISDNS
jgi:hypothetical protein